MYVPPAFREARISTLHEHIRSVGFGTLVTLGNAGLTASHLPMLLDTAVEPHGQLRGHLARANPQWRDVGPETEGLAIFVGPNAYVSPSWYPSKKVDGRVVPTWNYVAVHAYGPLRLTDDTKFLASLVTELTERYEHALPEPWQTTDAPADFLDRQLKGIVGFELPISRIEGKWKLSQNRPEGDQIGVAAGLAESADPMGRATAALMKKTRLP